MLRMLTERDERILLHLEKFKFMSRDQIRRVFELGTVRNANRVLRELGEYLYRVQDGHQSIYYLNKEGRQYVGSDEIVKKSGQVQHCLMRNDFWLFVNRPKDWLNEVEVSNKKGTVRVVSDAKYSIGGIVHLVEIDHLQHMRENREKIKKYAELLPAYALQMGHFPVLDWVTTTELRKQQLQEACKEKGLVCRVYLHREIKH
ncbi:MAG: replication-relaxation family protein [Psychrobacillus sp.]